MNTPPVRGRFAPSPTGLMHLGNAATALIAWLHVRSHGGTMVLRIEDLDPGRSTREYAEAIVEDLRWLGLDWDEGVGCGGPYGPYVQSERAHLYRSALAQLTAEGAVYPCYCTRRELREVAQAPHRDEGPLYPGTCRNLQESDARHLRQRKPAPSLRIRVPEVDIAFDDLVAGPQSDALHLTSGDFVVQRADGVAAYQLAVVVDDAQMRITHVVRGDDLLASTPRQIFLYRHFGWTPPAFAHVPLLLNHNGQRLAKRDGALTLRALKQRGMKPEQIVGYLAYRLGLSDVNEPMVAADLAGTFSFARVRREPIVVAGPQFG